MNLAERNGQLIAKLKALEEAKQLASQADYFEKRAEELKIAFDELAPIAELIVLLKKLKKIEFSSLSVIAIGSWNFRFTELRKQYLTDPQSILNPTPGEDARAVFLNPLKQLPVKIRGLVAVEWSSWANREIPPINDELIGVLSGVASMKSKVGTLRVLKRSAIESASKLPNSELEIERFLGFVKSIRQTWDELAGDGIPKEVIEFLRSAGRPEGANISQLTPAIHKWFSKHHLDQSLRIRVT